MWKTSMLARCSSFILLALPLLSVGCSDEEIAGPDAPATSDVALVEIDQRTLSFDAVGASEELLATAQDPSGAPVGKAELAWTTEGTGVVEIEVLGGAEVGAGVSRAAVTALGNGTETIRVVAGEARASVEVSVAQLPATLAATLSTDVLTRVGETARITVEVLDANGVQLAAPDAMDAVTFASSDPGIASVDADGRITANWTGDVTIAAALNDLDSTVDLEIRAMHEELGAPIVGETVTCSGGMAGPFPCDQIDLVAYLPPAALGVPEGEVVSDMWGWEDEHTGRRYALVARSDGTAFVDVTDPSQPRAIGVLPASVPSPLWRDLKVYEDHMYVVADFAPEHGVQVFDLTRLRGVSEFTRFTEDNRYTEVSAAHNIAINEETGFAYVVGSNMGGKTCGGGLHMIDLSQPRSPSFAGCFADPSVGFTTAGYVHDVQCVVYSGPDLDYAGREMCFGSNESVISITDVTDKSNAATIATAAYPDVAYAHQGWLTEDQRYFIQNDEGDEFGAVAATRMLVWDVEDLDDPILVREHFGPTGATDHNLYILGSRVYHSNYAFGFRVIDVADPLNPVEMGFFDTFPSGDEPGFTGSWSNYPFFDDGRVIVTSQFEGLFILEPLS